MKVIESGFIHYTASSGIPELKKVITEKLKRDHNLDYNLKEIIVSNGAKHGLYNALMAICNPGDEVLLPIPCWVSYTEQVKLAQVKLVFIPTSEENQFQLSAKQIERMITSKTRILLLNKPNNPTGNGVSKSYTMTGWRIGYAAGPEKVIKGMSEFQGHCIQMLILLPRKPA